jgi:isoquinoline 1-oxidoreductase beta subunit
MNMIIRGNSPKLSRRTFVVGSAAAGGGLALGFHLPFGVDPAPRSMSGSPSSPTTPA